MCCGRCLDSRACVVAHGWAQILRCHSARSGGYPVSSRNPPRPRRSYPPACRSSTAPGGTRDRDPRGRSPGRRRRPAPPALPVLAPPARRAGLAPLPRLDGRHGRGLALRAVAALALREERRAAARRARRPRRRPVLRRPRGRHRPGRDDVDARAAADDQHDGALRRRRRVPARSPTRSTPTRSGATCCRCSATGVPTGPRHPHATRDSLHEHEMWAVEGLTHRYPTKVLAELLTTCPQYCGHCTRMDLVGNSTPQVEKLKFIAKPDTRLHDMLDYLRRSPGVRDVVVSGGDVANMPWARLEQFVVRAARDRQRARHPPGLEGVRGAAAALAAGRRPRRHGAGRDDGAQAWRRPRDPHPREQRQQRHAARRRGDQGDARGRGARRAQPGRPHARRQRHA